MEIVSSDHGVRHKDDSEDGQSDNFRRQKSDEKSNLNHMDLGCVVSETSAGLDWIPDKDTVLIFMGVA